MNQELCDVTIETSTGGVWHFRIDKADKSAFQDGSVVRYRDIYKKWHEFRRDLVVSAQFMPVGEPKFK